MTTTDRSSEDDLECSESICDDDFVKISDDEVRKLSLAPSMTEFQRQKLEKDAKKNWDLFYKRNGDRFFKNRYWTRHEFQELFSSTSSHPTRQERKYLLEIGCGCGDFILPLLNCDSPDQENLFVYCCDISDRAIEILQNNPKYLENSPQKIKAFTANITDSNEDAIERLQSQLDGHEMDVVSLIFVLSALDPLKLKAAIVKIGQLLRPGGLVLFRDYAIHDKAMLRFNAKSKICDQFYVRQDGTRAYFFTKEQLIDTFEGCNFTIKSIEYVKRETVNNATGDKFTRIFLQAKMTKDH